MEDYEELMLQISDVMREANRVRPELSHEQAIKNIRGIVERRGKWVSREDMNYLDENKVTHNHFMCDRCGLIHDFIDGHTAQYNFCPNCGARMDLRGDV